MRTAMKIQHRSTGKDIFHGANILRGPQMPESVHLQYPRENALTVNDECCSFRSASLLDIPFIFNLIMDGSLTGAFPAVYATPKGSATLFLMLVRDILHPHRFVDNEMCDTKTFIFTQDNEEIGFMQIGHKGEGQPQVIKTCAISQEHRNQHHGSQMIRMYIENLPAATEVIAYCTKFNKAMPRVLKKLGFRRENADFGYDCYHLKDR